MGDAVAGPALPPAGAGRWAGSEPPVELSAEKGNIGVVKTSADVRTRDAVVHHLLSAGPSTAACLAAEFGVSVVGGSPPP